MLPSPQPLGLIDPDGKRTAYRGHPLPPPEVLRELHRRMVIGRRFDRQAGALTRQGRLAVYPSSHGQEACQIGGVLALGPGDWLFPTYRDSVALLTRGIDPVEVLTLLRGSWHSGYDPYRYKTGPQCTPLATNALHAVGLADAARRRGDDVAVLVLMGDGATSEGDAHEAFNFAAVYGAPVVFLIQNNGWAISVPLEKQSKAPTLAHKAVGYGIPGRLVDGNDAAIVYAVVHDALEKARGGGGPTVVEAVTYRIEAHTNADDPTRYRDDEEVAAWRRRDPIDRMEAYLRGNGLIDDAALDGVRAEAEEVAAGVRERMRADDHVAPAELFAHVYAEQTPQLREQAALLAAELAADADVDQEVPA
ncbi:pyruvate dehydrogenase E1 component alpha subunit [Thermocatellispora tengchongensis]|uniref:Pyruvate dehydrogenase E1 component alpha subunit n=1 Tax=Thermocatellispora tengchongensis TaxID=1073253 RepID=A0A840NYN3_9ACTN|nr:pyruvate dehydrogenase E1 component alpha subunit [Thermocatellispora tengchongensis]